MSNSIKFYNFWDTDQKELLKCFCRNLPFKDFSISDTEKLSIYSVFGKSTLKETKRIFYSGENPLRMDNLDIVEDENNLLYIVTNTHQDYPRFKKEKICYLPFFMMEYQHIDLYRGPSKQKKFCAFVVGNHYNYLGCQLRVKMVRELSKYKKVDCGGRVLNNIGYTVSRNIPEYLTWLNEYKFIISFENSFGNGYVTEKLFNGLCAGCIPVYWGDNKTAKKFFNPESFLCLETGNNSDTEIAIGIDKIIKRIIQLDTDPEEFYKINSQYPFLQSTTRYLHEVQERVSKVLDTI